MNNPTGPIILNSSRINNNFFISASKLRLLRLEEGDFLRLPQFDRCFHTRGAPLPRVLSDL